MSTVTPEGATPITSKDVVSNPEPERYEDTEIWAVTIFGKTETIPVMLERGERCKIQQSPLDGSFIGLLFEFKGGEKNEVTGRQFFNLGPGCSYKIAFHKMPVWREGDSPAERELKRREDIKTKTIQERAAKMAAGLDELLED